MPMIEGVEVRVKCNGQNLAEYDDPDTDKIADPDHQVKYIEAVSGAKFSIEVSLTKDFKYHGATAVDLGIRVDNLERRWYYIGVAHEFKPSMSRDSVTTFCRETGRYERAKLAFGTLSIVEDGDPSGGLKRTEQDALGRISVLLQRCHCIPMETTNQEWRKDICVSAISEKSLKGMAVDSTVKLIEGVACSQPRSCRWSPEYIQGRHGRQISVTLFYRSRRALQAIGCIPRSPSPEVSVQPAAEDKAVEVIRAVGTSNQQPAPVNEEHNSEEVRARVREMEKLRARLRELEGRQSFIKTEPSNGTASVKRERERSQGNFQDASPAPKRRQTLGEVEIVDLTED